MIAHPRGRTAVLWFRRDLRLHDHPALAAALTGAERVAPLFVLDPVLLAGRWRSPNRTSFMFASLSSLGDALEERGSPLHVRVGRPEDVVPRFAAEMGASDVHVSRDYAPYGRARDRRVAEALGSGGVGFHAARGQLIHEPEELATRAGTAYRVFGPFHRAWSALPLRSPLAAPDLMPAVGRAARPAKAGPRVDAWRELLRAAGLDPAVLDDLARPTADPDALPAAGERAARARLEAWTSPREGDPAPIAAYAERRDQLAAAGTSRLGQDLRWGLLSPVEVAARAIDAFGRPCASSDAPHDPTTGVERFIAELAWRDFYAHVLWHDPASARRATQRRYEAVPWRDDPAAIDAWQRGLTGFPVVDAAMRQLRATGWMHNRARMIVASFLTKDLLVDWRVGEAWFMRHLIDGDPASNNGGWQWAASTGTDAQPYFRVFDPVAQGRRFDPEGRYVRGWVPELEGVPTEYVHGPWTMPPDLQAAAGCRIGFDYPEPIVDHPSARRRAIEAYASTRD